MKTKKLKKNQNGESFNPQVFLDTAGVARKVVEYRRSESIYSQGEAAETVMYIQKGGVKLAVVNGSGKEAVVAMFGPTDFFGEGCMAGQTVRMGTATAITPTTLLVMDKTELLRVLHAEHELSDHFIKYMLAHNIRVEEDLVDQLFNSSEKRLARTLLSLARYGKQEQQAQKQQQQHSQQQAKTQQDAQQQHAQQQAKSQQEQKQQQQQQHSQQQAKTQQDAQQQQQHSQQHAMVQPQQHGGQQAHPQQVKMQSTQEQHRQEGEQRSAWQEHRATHFQSEHRDWQQRGGYNGYRIPDDRYRQSFGASHSFRIYSYPVVVVGGYPRFQYGGYYFSAVDPWPEYWADNWYDDDDVYIDYYGGGYYLYNRRYPRDRVAISVYLN